MKTIKIPLLVVFITLSFVAIYFIVQKEYSRPYKDISLLPSKKQSNEKIVKINNETISVEVADTAEKRRLGLSGRNSLKENYGMLFDFEEKDSQPIFWMKEMNFDIDIIWINDDVISQIDSNVPAPLSNTPVTKLPLYKPTSSIDYVLEVKSGYANEENIKVGDKVELPAL